MRLIDADALIDYLAETLPELRFIKYARKGVDE